MTAALHALEQDDVTRALPHAVGPEKSVLSSCLQESRKFLAEARQLGLTERHFYLPAHQIIFREMLLVDDEGDEVELVGFFQRLLDKGLLDRVGGPGYVSELYTYAPYPGRFQSYARELHKKRVHRGIIDLCNHGISSVYDLPELAEEHLDRLDAGISELRENGKSGSTAITAREAIQRATERFQRMFEGGQAAAGIATGFQGLTNLGVYLNPGNLFVVAARPSMGKTSFMMNIVEHVAVDLAIPTQVFSCEMAADEITDRLVSARSKVGIGKFKKGAKPDVGELQKMKRAMGEIMAAPLVIDDTPNISIADLRSRARRHHREHGTKFIAIDYLQLMKSTTKQARDNREREIAEISAGLKGLAKELGVAIMVLAQLNRGPENRTGKHLGVPRMSDLRESGSIEQDADMVGLLYRSAYYAESEEEKAEKEGVAELVLAKNRNGETGHVPLTFIAQIMRFEDGTPIRLEEPRQPVVKSRYQD